MTSLWTFEAHSPKEIAQFKSVIMADVALRAFRAYDNAVLDQWPLGAGRIYWLKATGKRKVKCAS